MSSSTKTANGSGNSAFGGLAPAAVRNPEDEFFNSQMLPPQERGITFEALFFRQLQMVTTRIHETENIDQIMLEASNDICKLFNADRLTLYAVSADGTSIISKVKTGLNTSRDLKLPITPQSIAGYVAMARTAVNAGGRTNTFNRCHTPERKQTVRRQRATRP